MVSPTQPTRLRSEVIRSPSLYLKELEVIEDVGSRGSHLLSGTRLKSIIIPFLFWLLSMMRMLYGWRNNPLRQSCEYICVLAQRTGYDHQPRQVYQQYLSNARGVIENYFRLYCQGVEAVIDRVTFAPEQTEMLNQLLAEYGGVVVAVPHNFGSAFSALKMHREFPLVLIARNPSTIARTKAALGMFERMQVSILMVRGGNPFELSRTLFSILKSGKVLAATLDNVDRSEHGVEAQFFGQQVGFPSWAAKVTARLGVPVVPSYFHSQGNQITGVLGEPLVSNELEMVAQHYVSFFEKKMLEDPASWAYLGDKRWRRVLREASEAAIAEK
jgi:lauroyl/myristoyl acyltransferase